MVRPERGGIRYKKRLRRKKALLGGFLMRLKVLVDLGAETKHTMPLRLGNGKSRAAQC